MGPRPPAPAATHIIILQHMERKRRTDVNVQCKQASARCAPLMCCRQGQWWQTQTSKVTHLLVAASLATAACTWGLATLLAL